MADKAPTLSESSHTLRLQSSNNQNDEIRSIHLFEVESVPVNVVEQEEVPPNGGYGWVIVFCVFLINAHTWGINGAWGIFLAYYLLHSTFPKASRLEYAIIGGLSVSQALMVSPLIAASNRKLGIRMTLIIGTALTFLALLGASYSTQIWQLILSQGVCFGWGLGFLYIPATAVLPQWFSSRRSLAMGLATSGAGLGGLAYSLAAGQLVERVGVNWTYRVLAFCSLAANLTCSLLVRDRNKTVKPSQTSFNYREYGRTEVLLLIVWGFATELGYVVLLYSLPNYATYIGLSERQGSVVGALLNLGLGIGRPLVGYYSDSLGRINMATLMTAICGLLCLILWVPAKTYPMLLAFALLGGTVCGTFWGTVAPVTAEVVGLRRLPSSFGMICLTLVLPATFAEPIGLHLVQVSGYLSSQVFVGCMFFLGAASTFLLRGWKLNEIEKKGQNERLGGEAGVTSLAATYNFWLSPKRLFSLTRV